MPRRRSASSTACGRSSASASPGHVHSSRFRHRQESCGASPHIETAAAPPTPVCRSSRANKDLDRATARRTRHGSPGPPSVHRRRRRERRQAESSSGITSGVKCSSPPRSCTTPLFVTSADDVAKPVLLRRQDWQERPDKEGYRWSSSTAKTRRLAVCVRRQDLRPSEVALEVPVPPWPTQGLPSACMRRVFPRARAAVPRSELHGARSRRRQRPRPNFHHDTQTICIGKPDHRPPRTRSGTLKEKTPPRRVAASLHLPVVCRPYVTPLKPGEFRHAEGVSLDESGRRLGERKSGEGGGGGGGWGGGGGCGVWLGGVFGWWGRGRVPARGALRPAGLTARDHCRPKASPPGPPEITVETLLGKR